MELIQAIALLCQISISSGSMSYGDTYRSTTYNQTVCQQSYLNCVLKRSNMTQTEALQKCILEK